MIIKKCNKCKIEKPITEFIKNKQCKNGYGNTCKSCQNLYSKEWKQNHAEEISIKGKIKYAETQGKQVKERLEERKRKYPLRIRCQILRSGMSDRSKLKNLSFDKEYFTVNYLMERLGNNPKCECCGKILDISYKFDKKFHDDSPSIDRVNSKLGYIKNNVAILCWRCNKVKQDSIPSELRIVADFIDRFNNQISNSIIL